MEFCLDRRLIGTDRHLLCADDGYHWIDRHIETIPILFNETTTYDDDDLTSLLRLNHYNIDVEVPKQFQHAIELLTEEKMNVPWSKVLPVKVFRTYLKALIDEVRGIIGKLSKDYYNTVWVPGNTVLRSIDRSVVDVLKWRSLLFVNEGNIAALKSFKPVKDGITRLPIYDRLGTVTGRLKIVKGPDIMTLRKDHRSIIKSRWGLDGKIMMLDFGQLEVRVLLYEANGICDEYDLYTTLNYEMFDGLIGRNDIKGAVISELYGQSKEVLGTHLSINGNMLDSFIERIKGRFKTNLLVERLKPEFVSTGFITNRYGRKIKVDNPQDHVLVNYYAQSTGVDVTLLGFKEVINALSGSRNIPIFLLHDAMFLDCHVDDVHIVKNIKHVLVPGFEQKFPLRIEQVVYS